MQLKHEWRWLVGAALLGLLVGLAVGYKVGGSR